MCFTKKKRKQRQKIYRVYPEPLPPTFTTDEIILCSGCNKNYKLTDIKINCAGCDKFFHCKIAGVCNGEGCNVLTSSNKNHKLSWCINCAKYLPGKNEIFICNKCK